MNPNTPKTTRRGPIIIYLILVVLMMFALYKLISSTGEVDLKYSEVVNLFNDKQVEAFEIQNDTIKMQLRTEYKGQKILSYKLYDFSLFYEDLGDTIAEQLKDKTLTEYIQDVIRNNNSDAQPEERDGLIFYRYRRSGMCGWNYAMKGEDAFYLVQFMCREVDESELTDLLSQNQGRSIKAARKRTLRLRSKVLSARGL